MRVMLVENDWVWASAVAYQFERAPGILLIGTAGDARQAIEMARDGAPDLALLALVPHADESGLYVARRLRLAGVSARLVVMTTEPSVSAAARARQLGLDGFVDKAHLATPEDLVALVRKVGAGEQAFDGRVNDNLSRGLRAATEYGLKLRDLEVIDLLVQGFSTEEIADRLHLRPQSVLNRVRDIGRKLDVSGRAKIVAKALREGISAGGGLRARESLSAGVRDRLPTGSLGVGSGVM